ncbi:unnamed protein product [Laminaria digitata]
MDWVQEHCDRLRSELQDILDGCTASAPGSGVRKGLRVPWSWVCRSIIETVQRYPSGLTKAVILAELELLWRRDVRGAFVPGKLRAYLDAQYAPLSDVIQACVVGHSDQLVTLVEDHSRAVSCEQSPTMVDMYLHQNFKSCFRFAQNAGHDLLASGRKLRLTGCRMLTGAAVHPCRGGGSRGAGGRRSPDGAGSTLLLTEYLAFVLDHRRSDDIKLAAGVFGRTRVRGTFHKNANDNPFFVICKVVEVRRPRQHQDRSNGLAQKRRWMVQTVVLECAGRRRGPDEEDGDGDGPREGIAADGERETVLLHLWDEQTCLTSLFQKGDGLALYWPWLVQSDPQDAAGGRIGFSQAPSLSSQASSRGRLPPIWSPSTPHPPCWHYEYGSATALFVLPRESRARLFSAVNGDAADALAATAGGVASLEFSKRIGTGEGARAEDTPVDENGARDLLQFPRRLSVADLIPNMSNASVYGQVISVLVPEGPLPAVLSTRSGLASANQESLSQLHSKPLLLQPPCVSSSALEVVELGIRDARGQARVLCCGHKAAGDALRCRPGHFVLACGLRTFAPAFPPLDVQHGADVVVFCGEPEEAQEGAAAREEGIGTRTGGGGGGGGGGGEGGGGISVILNASCLEGLLNCPFMSRHSLLRDQGRAPGPRGTFACKVAITWARWTFEGDGLWAFHRPCGTRLPCHYGAVRTSADCAQKTGRKRARDMREPGARGTAGAQETPVTCPLCKSRVRAASPDEAELGYAPLLLALDDGSRCIVAECRSEVVTAALGGIHAAHFFLQMGPAEREATLGALIGREVRCVVGGNGAGVRSSCSGGGCEGGEEEGADWSGGNGGGGGVEYRVERISSTNPAADLAHLLS